MTAYRLLFDHVFARTDAEWAHETAFRAIRAAGPATRVLTSRKTAVSVMGLDFPEVLGLAAGFDKNAVGIDALAALGFGFVEIGTVTAEPQPGNPKPRLVRLPPDRAVVNRMGFNNDGAEVIARRLAGRVVRRPGRGQHRQDEGRPRGRRRRGLREEHDAARAARRLPGRQRVVAEHARSPRPAGRREARAAAASRAPAGRRGHRGARAAAGEDRPGPRRRRRARGRRPRRWRRTSTASWPPTPPSRGTGWPARPRRSRRPAPVGSRARRCGSAPPTSYACCGSGSGPT